MKRYTALLTVVGLLWISVASVAAQGSRVLLPLVLRSGESGTTPLPTVAVPTATHSAIPSSTPTATVSPTLTASPTVTTSPTRTATATMTPTATSSATATQPPSGPTVTPEPTPETVLEQLLLNGDFEDGSIHWGQVSNGYDVNLIKDDVGQYYSWGAELGGRFGAEDFLVQFTTIPSDAILAWVAFDVKMKSFESSDTPRSAMLASLIDSSGNVLASLGYYDNTMTSYLWTRKYSGDLTEYRGRIVGVAFLAVTEGLTTFYIDDVSFGVERPAM